MSYATFREFVDAARSGVAIKAASTLNRFQSGELRTLSAANSSVAPSLPQEGVAPAIFPGYHIYVKLDLRPSFTTSSELSQRSKGISLLADLTQGVRQIVHEFDGALLEAQGPVVHAFIPEESAANQSDVQTVSGAILEFVERRIRSKAGEDFKRILIAYCHGPTAFVGSVDQHGDNSIVSLAPAANEPAKVLWGKSDNMESGSVVEVLTDGRFRILNNQEQRQALNEGRREVVVNASLALPEMTKEARELSVAPPHSPNSPTVEDPHESYSISVRADMDGFTSRVKKAFEMGRASVLALAEEFHRIMLHARKFGVEAKAIHLPWAGDCFNLLLAFDARDDYAKNRQRRILEILGEFEKHMASEFPGLKWAYSCAAGEIENAQKSNTLVTRVTVGHTTLLLATGLPVERSLIGLANESPKAGCGVLWKGDVSALDEDLKAVIQATAGGENYRHFSVSEVEKARQRTFFAPPKPAYVTSATSQKAGIVAPLVRPYSAVEGGR